MGIELSGKGRRLSPGEWKNEEKKNPPKEKGELSSGCQKKRKGAGEKIDTVGKRRAGLERSPTFSSRRGGSQPGAQKETTAKKTD